MIYLVSHNKALFGSDQYKEAELKEVIPILETLKLVQLDTETMGLDAHTKKLLTIQLGNKKNQIVFDWQSLTSDEKTWLKQYLESNRTFLGWNLMFDLIFLYVQDIWVKNVWDGMVVEKLIYLGYPHDLSIAECNDCQLKGYAPSKNSSKVELSYSLKAAAMRWCGIDIDKTVRGEIINEGLTERVIVYAAEDVMHLEDIKDAQEKVIADQNLQNAVILENEFIKSLAYFKYCGIHLDVLKWQNKMNQDLAKVQEAEADLNEWVINWDLTRKNKEEWDIQYPELNIQDPLEVEQTIQKLVKKGYQMCSAENLTNPDGSIVHAFRKRIANQFTKIDRLGTLFSGDDMSPGCGFDTRPKCTINWSSQQQVVPLFEKLGIDCTVFDPKTKTKKKSINAKVIKPQIEVSSILPIYLRYVEAQKVVSTYGQNWINAINPKTGRIHVEFDSLGTNTARVSSGGGPYKLNLQFGGPIM